MIILDIIFQFLGVIQDFEVFRAISILFEADLLFHTCRKKWSSIFEGHFLPPFCISSHGPALKYLSDFLLFWRLLWLCFFLFFLLLHWTLTSRGRISRVALGLVAALVAILVLGHVLFFLNIAESPTSAGRSVDRFGCF